MVTNQVTIAVFVKPKKILTNNLITLLKKKPIHQISVKELTDLCDLNRGTFLSALQRYL